MSTQRTLDSNALHSLQSHRKYSDMQSREVITPDPWEFHSLHFNQIIVTVSIWNSIFCAVDISTSASGDVIIWHQLIAFAHSLFLFGQKQLSKKSNYILLAEYAFCVPFFLMLIVCVCVCVNANKHGKLSRKITKCFFYKNIRMERTVFADDEQGAKRGLWRFSERLGNNLKNLLRPYSRSLWEWKRLVWVWERTVTPCWLTGLFRLVVGPLPMCCWIRFFYFG